MSITIIECEDPGKWNEFVRNHPHASLSHLFEWKDVFSKVYNHQTICLALEEDNRIKGILPLTFMKSRIFRNQLVSVPYFSVGGLLVEHPDMEILLLQKVWDMFQKFPVSQLEIRQQNPLGDIPDIKNLYHHEYTGKSLMIRMLPPSSEELFSEFKAKLRSQIRRPQKEGMNFKIGGQELLRDFYSVFAINMRDLGSPVHKKEFFDNLVSTFQDYVKVGVVYWGERPVASGIIFHFNGGVEIPWASSLRKFNKYSPNMLLYWEFLKYSADNGYKFFDFGRSTPDEGTYRFKRQWGAEAVPLHWYYWSAKPLFEQYASPDSKSRKIASRIWSKLPVQLATLLGGKIRGQISL